MPKMNKVPHIEITYLLFLPNKQDREVMQTIFVSAINLRRI